MQLLKENMLIQFLAVGAAGILVLATLDAFLFVSWSATIAAAPWLGYALVVGSVSLLLRPPIAMWYRL